ncbi:heterokaryon incompatibility protein-domain-containing protein [Aspergillus pseudocaelatus]|uniref:Heterokaryon incompatibility protein-domain-containing protein n=1 Tax=Aspergillus pseudocaelatus TaxID=1825620 RepID=A0ABQ6WPG1_9EURO|nr:heterokaryon incompatibility protein-domain-containing protein [Aspergillus pseudocaelatus]
MLRRNFADPDLDSSSSSDSSDDPVSQTDEDDEISTSDSSSEQDSLETSSSIPDEPSTHLPQRPCKIRLHPGRLTFRTPSDHASEQRKATFLEEFQLALKEWHRSERKSWYRDDDFEARERMEQIEKTIPRFLMELPRESPMSVLRHLLNEISMEMRMGLLVKTFMKIQREILEDQSREFFRSLGRLEESQIGQITFEGKQEGAVCRLNIESLEKTSSPVYAALSYCWGTELYSSWLYVLPPDVPFDRRMQWQDDQWEDLIQQCKGFRIGENLKRALLRLRREDESITLWVDAICINQNNEEEKTQQLLQMAKVYRMANYVCVWLGEADSDKRSNRAMRYIPKIMDFAFLERAFSRRWVVQEISLAKEASVYCGKMAVPWTEFADAVSILVAYQEKIKGLFKSWREGVQTLGEVQSFGANKLLQATTRLFQRDAKGVAQNPLKGIEYLVTSLSTFDASKPRDIVYSLVSIASDTYDPVSYDAGQEGDDNNKDYKLAIDYKLDEVEVYRNFVKYCILSSGSLDIICRPWAMPKIGKGRLPTWIRLLQDSEFGEPTEVYNGRKNGESLLGPVGSPLYKASRGIKFTDPSTRTTPSSRKKRKTEADASDARVVRQISSTLLAKGFKLAKVEAVSLVNASGLIPRRSLLDIAGWAGVDENPEEVPDHIWRTLIADRDFDGQIPPTLYQRVCLWCLDIADTFHNGHFNTDQLLHEESDMLRAYLTRVRNVTWNRRFFRALMKAPHTDSSYSPSGQTERDNEVSGSEEEPSFEEGKRQWTENDLFGLCPEATTLGDFICILYGCSVPVILRQSTRDPKCYKVIGECYVHGKMEGEAVEDCKEEKTLGTDEVFGLI